MSGFERDPYLRVTAMNAADARTFAMPDAVMTVCTGQADPLRHRFGARIYLLFQTWPDYQTWLKKDGEAVPAEIKTCPIS